MILRARSLLGPDGRIFEGGVEVVGRSITRVLLGVAAVRRAGDSRSVRDLGEGLLAPGYVNAHAHLELGSLHRRLPPGAAFVDWIRALLVERSKLTEADFRNAVSRGARRALETGTTSLGDIAADPLSSGEPRGRLRTVLYREVLDAGDPTRAEVGPRRRLPPRSLRTEGLAPHAPYTLSEPLMKLLAARLAERPMPSTIHWAESVEEVAWMERGVGPLKSLLRHSPGCSPLEHLVRGGLVKRGTSLVHGNCPGPGDIQRLAAAGIPLVHCPGSHAFFARAPFPLDAYRRAGVRVALGTDSLASNEDLDMGREMALLRASAPHLAPAEVLRMATEAGARALGLGERIGRIEPGRLADLAFHRVDRSAPLEALTQGEGEVEGVWIGGRRVFRRLSGRARALRPGRSE